MENILVIRILILTLFFLSLIGCSSGKRIKIDDVRLRETSLQELIDQLGDPRLYNKYQSETGSSAELRWSVKLSNRFLGRSRANATLEVETDDGKVVSYYFNCQAKKVSPIISPDQLTEIESGVTTEDEVFEMLAPPVGQAYGDTEMAENIAESDSPPYKIMVWRLEPKDNYGGSGSRNSYLILKVDQDGVIINQGRRDREIRFY